MPIAVKRVYVRYQEWEDWLNGMWRKLHSSEEQWMLNKAVKFTGDYKNYGGAMKEVLYAWPRTMLHNLTNTSLNRRAFLGHCACSFKFNCPEYITRMAWHLLTDEQREKADRVAQRLINKWLRELSSI